MPLKSMKVPCLDCPFRKDTSRGIISSVVKQLFYRKDNLCHKTTDYWNEPNNLNALTYDSSARLCKGAILARNKKTTKGINRSLRRMLMTHSSKFARRVFEHYSKRRKSP